MAFFQPVTVVSEIPKTSNLEEWSKFVTVTLKNNRALLPQRVKIEGTQSIWVRPPPQAPSEYEHHTFLSQAVSLAGGETKRLIFNVNGGSHHEGLGNVMSVRISSSFFGFFYMGRYADEWTTEIITRDFVLLTPEDEAAYGF